MSNAVNINPPNAEIHISASGSDFLWAMFAVFAFTLLCTIAVDFLRPKGTRLFHQIAVIILTTSSIAYFSMASDLGATAIETEFRRQGTRQVWYVRYIQWFITFPLLLLEVLLTTGLSLSDIITTLFMALTAVVCLLVGALTSSTYKWGFYTFGVSAVIYIWIALLWYGPRTTAVAGGAYRRTYFFAASYISFMLIAYPICWGISEGSNMIKPTDEMIFYAVLDVIIGPVFLAGFLFAIRNYDYTTLGLGFNARTGAAAKAAEAGVLESGAHTAM